MANISAIWCNTCPKVVTSVGPVINRMAAARIVYSPLDCLPIAQANPDR
jgi:hypothetical protein